MYISCEHRGQSCVGNGMLTCGRGRVTWSCRGGGVLPRAAAVLDVGVVVDVDVDVGGVLLVVVAVVAVVAVDGFA